MTNLTKSDIVISQDVLHAIESVPNYQYESEHFDDQKCNFKLKLTSFLRVLLYTNNAKGVGSEMLIIGPVDCQKKKRLL